MNEKYLVLQVGYDKDRKIERKMKLGNRQS